MKITPTMVKKKLDTAVADIAKVGWLYTRDPGIDFTRKRKLPIESMLHLMLKFCGKSLQGEISAYYSSPLTSYQRIPTKSAFTQQSKKLLWEGCYNLFRYFTDSLPYMKLFDGYRLLACDGSTVPIPHNEKETDFSVVTREDRKSYNQLHINGLYDIQNHIYVDCIINSGMHIRERAALIDMVNRLDNPSKAIILADRGYEGYNDLAHLIATGTNFLIRAKDLDSNGFLHTLSLPANGEIDIDVDRLLTFNRNLASQNPDLYANVYRGHFDFLTANSDSYPIHFRLVRIQLDNGAYECLVTNLPRDSFSPKKLKKLYSLRWKVENAYRDLKYTVDLLHFHGKSSGSVLQEVFCSLTMFNFCAYLCTHSDVLSTNKCTKYRYKINFANAVGPRRSYLHGSIGETELLNLLRLSPVPIRPDRHVQRPSRIREQTSREFNYRAS